MKSVRRTYTLVFLLALSSIIFAQDAIKYPLLEHFTNTRCPICASRNPGFHDLRQSFGDQVNHIAFHPKYPYSSCEFYQANMEGNQSRTEHYGINGTPVVYLDGSEGQGTDLVRASAIEMALQENSFFELEVTEEGAGSNVIVSVIIKARGDAPAGSSYRLFVATVEETVDYSAPNGENMHYNVFRTFSSSRAGVPVSPIDNMQSDTFTFQYQLDNEWNTSEMYSIAFLQNDQDGSIENSGRSSGIISSSEEIGSQINIAYPSPTNGRIFFTQEVERAEIYSITGRLQLQQIFNGGMNSMDVGALTPGVYFISMKTNGQSRNQKIIID